MDAAAEEVAPIDNPWASPPSVAPTRSLATQPKKPAPALKARVPSPSPVPTPISSPPPPDPDGWGDNSWVDAEGEMKKPATPVVATVNLASLSKEEKAAEIARRKEERKQVRASFVGNNGCIFIGLLAENRCLEGAKEGQAVSDACRLRLLLLSAPGQCKDVWAQLCQVPSQSILIIAFENSLSSAFRHSDVANLL